MSHAANTSIQDIQNGIGDFALLPKQTVSHSSVARKSFLKTSKRKES